MTLISYKENEKGQLIPFDGKLALSDFENPETEAIEWSRSIYTDENIIVCIGLGGGWHIHELCLRFPDKEICVIETRSNLVRHFQHKFGEISNLQIQIVENFGDIAEFALIEEIVSRPFKLIAFKKCWGEQTKVFQEILWFLTFRTVESFRIIGALHGLHAKIQNKNQLISIRDLHGESENYPLKVLQEIIR